MVNLKNQQRKNTDMLKEKKQTNKTQKQAKAQLDTQEGCPWPKQIPEHNGMILEFWGT